MFEIIRLVDWKPMNNIINYLTIKLKHIFVFMFDWLLQGILPKKVSVRFKDAKD